MFKHHSGMAGDCNFADSAIAVLRHMACWLSCGTMNIAAEKSGCQEQVRAALR
jgi:hypothetical protein